jgi:hypothetical protein
MLWKTRTWLAAAVLASGFGMTAEAAILANGGFETGDLTGWNMSGDVAAYSCASAAPGCPAGFGNWIATLNNFTLGVGNASLTQAVDLAPGTYAFGAKIAYGTSVIGGNFTGGQISLTVQGQGVSETVGFDPNALGAGAFPIFLPQNGFYWTEWFDLTGTLTYAGGGLASFLININIQNFDPAKPLVLDVDNVFIAPIPLPAGILLLGTAIAGLGVLRRRPRKAETFQRARSSSAGVSIRSSSTG